MAIGKGVLCYRSWQLSNDDDVGLIFTFHTQFPEVFIIELFVVLKESHFNSGGSASNATYIPVSQSVHSPTFAMASPVQNENVQNENADDLMGDPSFHQLAMQIVKLLSRVGPNTSYDFTIDDGDDKEEPIEVPFDSDSGEDEVAKPIT